MGDFNMKPNNCMFKSFLDSNNLTNLIKTYTYFNGKGSSIYLILTNRKYSFKYTSSYETGLSDHHHMIYTMLKSSFINIGKPFCVNCKPYFSNNHSKADNDIDNDIVLSEDGELILKPKKLQIHLRIISALLLKTLT